MLSFNAKTGFCVSDELAEAVVALDDQVARYRSGTLPRKQMDNVCDVLLAKFSGLIEAPFTRGVIAFEKGEFAQSRRHAEVAIAIAEAVMPANFTGQLSWYEFENRPYLRALHLKALCEMEFFETKAALAICQKAYAMCPEDGIGFRFLISTLLLQSGDFSGALTHLKALKDFYPATDYQLALASYRSNLLADAAYHLRRGIVTCSYYADALLGETNIRPQLRFHVTNDLWPSAAIEHAKDHSQLWREDGQAFIAYVYNHPDTMADRAAVARMRYDHYVSGGALQDDKVRSAIAMKDCKAMVQPINIRKRGFMASIAMPPWLIGETSPDGTLDMPTIVRSKTA